MPRGTITKEKDEKWRKSIPALVFYNHFKAIYRHIQLDSSKWDLKKVSFYYKLKIKNKEFNLDSIRRLLWNSWSTEYALNMANNIENVEYYKFALHWAFPQVYYSVYLNMTAFHETQGNANDKHEKSIKIFGNSVKGGHYPACISFYAKGGHNAYKFKNLPLFSSFTRDFNGLQTTVSPEEYQKQIAMFLKSTREQNVNDKREKLNSNDNRFQTKQGTFKKNFSKVDWNVLYASIPETSLLNMLYRLRIKANYREIQAFIEAEVDFKRFYKHLAKITYYLNYVHEGYIQKAIGDSDYQSILTGFGGHINQDLAVNRYEQIKQL